MVAWNLPRNALKNQRNESTSGQKTPRLHPFVQEPAERSNVICTIDLAEHVNAEHIAQALRKNGVVDTEPYRKLGRNQLRIATFTAIEPDDVSALLRCIDFLVNELAPQTNGAAESR